MYKNNVYQDKEVCNTDKPQTKPLKTQYYLIHWFTVKLKIENNETGLKDERQIVYNNVNKTNTN